MKHQTVPLYFAYFYIIIIKSNTQRATIIIINFPFTSRFESQAEDGVLHRCLLISDDRMISTFIGKLALMKLHILRKIENSHSSQFV